MKEVLCHILPAVLEEGLRCLNQDLNQDLRDLDGFSGWGGV